MGGIPLLFAIHALHMAMNNRKEFQIGSVFSNFFYTLAGVFGGEFLAGVFINKPLASMYSEKELIMVITICYLVYYTPRNAVYRMLSYYPVELMLENIHHLILLREVLDVIGTESVHFKEPFPIIRLHPVVLFAALCEGVGGLLVIALGRMIERKNLPDFREHLRLSLLYSIVYCTFIELDVMNYEHIQLLLVILTYIIMLFSGILQIDLLSPLERVCEYALWNDGTHMK